MAWERKIDWYRSKQETIYIDREVLIKKEDLNRAIASANKENKNAGARKLSKTSLYMVKIDSLDLITLN